MTFNFTEGEPVAAAVQFGNRAFKAATLQNGKLVFTLPPAVTPAITSFALWAICLLVMVLLAHRDRARRHIPR
jgi:hypothetical protein